MAKIHLEFGIMIETKLRIDVTGEICQNLVL